MSSTTCHWPLCQQWSSAGIGTKPARMFSTLAMGVSRGMWHASPVAKPSCNAKQDHSSSCSFTRQEDGLRDSLSSYHETMGHQQLGLHQKECTCWIKSGPKFRDTSLAVALALALASQIPTALVPHAAAAEVLPSHYDGHNRLSADYSQPTQTAINLDTLLPPSITAEHGFARGTPTTQQAVTRLLASVPLLAASTSQQPGLWLQLGVLILANVLGLQAVFAVLKRAGDRAEPVTLVRIQLGIVVPGNTARTRSIEQLRGKLSQLSSMIQAGQHGMWLILEEAILELSKHQKEAALADVTVVRLESKKEAYDLFGEISKHELKKAKAEEVLAHAQGEGDCAVDWEKVGRPAKYPGQGLVQWLSGQPGFQEGSGCDDAVIVTLVVATRGQLQLPASVASWQELCAVFKTICGLSSERLMAVDLTWAPSTDGTYLTRDKLLADYANLTPIKH